MSGKELLKKAKAVGWREKSTNGSHVKLVHISSKTPVIVPNHGSKDIPTGTLNKILKQLGLK